MMIGSFWFASSWVSRLDLIQVLTWNEDDALYYCQIAKNTAAGKFSTFDGGLSRTNGYHPAWMLVITPLYWVLDPEAALYATLLTNDYDSSLADLLRRYARRWLVEQPISEQLSFFHLNRRASSMVLKVDFDLTLTVLASNL